MSQFRFLFFLVLFCLKAHSGVSPVAIVVFPLFQFPPENFTVAGTRLSLLWGAHQRVYGLDFGVVGNISTEKFVGASFSGFFHSTNGSATLLGTQFSGVLNFNSGKTDVSGLQAATVMNMNSGEGQLEGLQIALGNHSPKMDVYGLQLGLYNRLGEIYGVQFGMVNLASEVVGIQFGLVNYTQTLRGVQFGLFNICTKGVFPYVPVLNVGF